MKYPGFKYHYLVLSAMLFLIFYSCRNNSRIELKKEPTCKIDTLNSLSAGNYFLSAMTKCKNGDFMFAGWIDKDYYFIKMKPNGDTLRTKRIKDTSGGRILSIQETSEGNFILKGEYDRSNLGVGICSGDYILYVDKECHILWEHFFKNKTDVNGFKFIAENSKGDFLLPIDNFDDGTLTCYAISKQGKIAKKGKFLYNGLRAVAKYGDTISCVIRDGKTLHVFSFNDNGDTLPSVRCKVDHEHYDLYDISKYGNNYFVVGCDIKVGITPCLITFSQQGKLLSINLLPHDRKQGGGIFNGAINGIMPLKENIFLMYASIELKSFNSSEYFFIYDAFKNEYNEIKFPMGLYDPRFFGIDEKTLFVFGNEEYGHGPLKILKMKLDY